MTMNITILFLASCEVFTDRCRLIWIIDIRMLTQGSERDDALLIFYDDMVIK